jgi:zinc ribbon protein
MPLIACPDCGKQISDQAPACPHCGYPISQKQHAIAKPPPETAAKPQSQALALGCLFVLLLAGVGIFALFFGVTRSTTPSVSTSANHSTPSSEPTTPSEATTQTISDVSWDTINYIYNLGSKYTDLQKDKEWTRFKGKRVKWTGQVRAISQSFGSVTMQVKMNPDTLTSDLIITLKDTEKSKAERLREGDSVTFVATLTRWGTVLPISMSDGEIIN